MARGLKLWLQEVEGFALSIYIVHENKGTDQVHGIGRFQSIKTGVLLIFSFITGDKIEFLPPMMLLNEYITGT